jgi:hypothetical protein
VSFKPEAVNHSVELIFGIAGGLPVVSEGESFFVEADAVKIFGFGGENKCRINFMT